MDNADVTAVMTLVANPFAGNCTGCTGPVQSGSTGTNATTKAAQLLLPYPQFDDFTLAEYDNRNSIYHSMQLKVQKRFSAGAQLLASYTVAKLIDDTNSEINWLEAASPSWGDANAYNLRGERSLDGFDVSQRLVIGSILDLPVGQGKLIGKNVSAITEKVIGGWGVNTIFTFQTSFPIIVGGCPGALSNSGLPEVGCARTTRTGVSHLEGGSKDQKPVSGTTLLFSRPALPTTTGMAPIRVPSRTYVRTGKRTSTLPRSKTSSLARMAVSYLSSGVSFSIYSIGRSSIRRKAGVPSLAR